MRKILQITGLDCANCARELEKIIAKTEGVKSVSLVFVTQKLTLEYDGEETLERIISIINSFEIHRQLASTKIQWKKDSISKSNLTIKFF